MRKRLTASELPCATVFGLLPDDELERIESDEDRSTYSYLCGCIAVRLNDSEECTMSWCSAHRPQIHAV